MKSSLLTKLQAIAILGVIVVFNVSIVGNTDVHSQGTFSSSIYYDALNDKPSHVNWVVIKSKNVRTHGGNSGHFLINKERVNTPSHAPSIWLRQFYEEKHEPNLYFLNKENKFIPLGVNISVSTLQHLRSLFRHKELLDSTLTNSEIISSVIGKPIHIPED